MRRRIEFRHRIALLVSLAALALVTVAAVTLVLGRKNVQQLAGIETRYLPLIELDRDLKTTFAAIPRALEDAASAAEDTKLDEADRLERAFAQLLAAGAKTIAGNGGDAAALAGELERYYATARGVSAKLVDGADPAELATEIEAMRAAQQAFTTDLDAATAPNRERLAAAFATARETQTTSLRIDIAVAAVALALMAVLSWWIISRTVNALRAVSSGVERLARLDLEHEIDVTPGDELGDLAREANRTAGHLRDYRERVEREVWIKTGIGELSDRIAGDRDAVEVADRGMRFLAGYIAATAAAAYAVDERAASPPGDGPLRRLAVDGKVPARTTLGDGIDVRTEPVAGGHAIVVPLVHHDRALGALELIVPTEPAPRTLDLLARIRDGVGLALRVAESRERERDLLVQTQRQAIATETANKELEAFSYSVSHDLRAPLRGIDGFSQALLEDHADVLPAKGQDYLRRIRAAAQRMAELIDDLLRLSRVSRGDFRRDKVDLTAIVNGIAADLRRNDAARTVEITAQTNVTAVADPRLMKITLENLLGNAWKFTAKTEAPCIEFGARDDNGERIYFVRDNGAGFDMKYAERLFGAFQRLHSDKEFPGTGIGLATVQRIIHRHGGRIWVEAAVARGATFQFTLPTEPTAATGAKS